MKAGSTIGALLLGAAAAWADEPAKAPEAKAIVSRQDMYALARGFSCGDGSAQVNIDTTSGNVRLEAAEQ